MGDLLPLAKRQVSIMGAEARLLSVEGSPGP